MPSASAIRPPQQERSRATLLRFLEATTGLLAERRFEQATVAEIARRARSSVGAFYARFADKDALMEYLDSQLFESGKAAWDEFLASERWRGKGAAEVVSGVVERVARKRREHRGLLRALALYARSQPTARFVGHATELNRHVHAGVRALLLERREEIGHSDPEQAIEIGACRIINIKLGRVGGFSEALLVHNVARANGVPVWCGGMLESGVGRAHNIALSTLDNFKLPGDVSASKRYWQRDIIQPPVEVSPGGLIEVRDEPGFGYEIDRDYLRAVTQREEVLA